MNMKDIKRFKQRLGVAVVTGVSMCMSSYTHMAKGQNLGQQVLDKAGDSLTELLDDLVRLLQIVMALGALVVLAMVVFKIFKGDREAAEKLAWWVAGLAIGFVLLSVVAGLVRGSVSQAQIGT